MPIKDGTVLTRNNELLSGILGRQSVSFSQSLSAVTQSNRDQINRQAGQERSFLGERRFFTQLQENQFKDRRNFKEATFQDRRNFGRKVLESDRGFAENVRQFNVQDANADASRGLQRELGFANLSRQDRRLDLAEKDSNRNFDLRFNADSRAGEESVARIAQINSGTELNNFKINESSDDAITAEINDQRDVDDALETISTPEKFKASLLYDPNSKDPEADRLRLKRAIVIKSDQLRQGRVDTSEARAGLDEAAKLRGQGQYEQAEQVASRVYAQAKASGQTSIASEALTLTTQLSDKRKDILKDTDSADPSGDRARSTKANESFESARTIYERNFSKDNSKSFGNSLNDEIRTALSSSSELNYVSQNSSNQSPADKQNRRQFYKHVQVLIATGQLNTILRKNTSVDDFIGEALKVK